MSDNLQATPTDEQNKADGRAFNKQLIIGLVKFYIVIAAAGDYLSQTI